MNLDASIALLNRGVDIELSINAGQTLALMGPNGAGKTTVLEVLAGLLAPNDGRGVLGGRVLFDVRGGRGAWVPPHRRGVTLMAQRPFLFPHLTVLENVAFAPRSAGLGRAAAREVARGWLERVDAYQLAARRPDELSGGQAQRVALARALAAKPDLLLLDEPLAPVDTERKAQLRDLLAEVLLERTAVLVTHDRADADALATRTVHLDGGRLL